MGRKSLSSTSGKLVSRVPADVGAGMVLSLVLAMVVVIAATRLTLQDAIKEGPTRELGRGDQVVYESVRGGSRHLQRIVSCFRRLFFEVVDGCFVIYNLHA